MLLRQTYFGRSPDIINTSYCASFVPWVLGRRVLEPGTQTELVEGVEEGERTIKLIVWANLTNLISGWEGLRAGGEGIDRG